LKKLIITSGNTDSDWRNTWSVEVKYINYEKLQTEKLKRIQIVSLQFMPEVIV